jgi:hypothetical protein
MKLADYCITCLLLPVSNTFVERVFSQVNYVKNKLRNNSKLRYLSPLFGPKSSAATCVATILLSQPRC